MCSALDIFSNIRRLLSLAFDFYSRIFVHSFCSFSGRFAFSFLFFFNTMFLTSSFSFRYFIHLLLLGFGRLFLRSLRWFFCLFIPSFWLWLMPPLRCSAAATEASRPETNESSYSGDRVLMTARVDTVVGGVGVGLLLWRSEHEWPADRS